MIKNVKNKESLMEYATWDWVEQNEKEVLRWPSSWYRNPIPEPMCTLMGQGIMNKTITENEGEYEITNDFEVIFQCVTMDYKTFPIENDIPVTFKDGSTATKTVILREEPEIRMTGTTKDGNSICMRVRGFLPYFRVMVDIPKNVDIDINIDHKKIEYEIKQLCQYYLALDVKERESFRVARMHANVACNLISRINSAFLEEISDLDNITKNAKRRKETPTIFFVNDESHKKLRAGKIGRVIGVGSVLDENKHYDKLGENEPESLFNKCLKIIINDISNNCKSLIDDILAVGGSCDKTNCPHWDNLYDTYIENSMYKAPVSLMRHFYTRTNKTDLRLPLITFIDVADTHNIGRNMTVIEREIVIKKKNEDVVKSNKKKRKKKEIKTQKITQIRGFSRGIGDNNDKKKHDSTHEVTHIDLHCKLCKEIIILADYIHTILRRITIERKWRDPKNVDISESFFNERRSIKFELLFGNDIVDIPKMIQILKCSFEQLTSLISDHVLLPLINFYKSAHRSSIFEKDKTQYVSNITYEEKSHQSIIRFPKEYVKGVKETGWNKDFIRIELYSPPNCYILRNAIQYGGLLTLLPHTKNKEKKRGRMVTIENDEDNNKEERVTCVQTFESDIQFTTRFSRDVNITGMGYVAASSFSWEPIPVWHKDRKSKCQIEVLIKDYSGGNVEGRNATDHDPILYGGMTPMRWLVYDIEVASFDTNRFCSPNNIGDIVTQISCIQYDQGNSKTPIETSVFCLGGCCPLLRKCHQDEELTDVEREMYKKTRIYSFESEREMFVAFRRMIEISSFDFIQGYNSVAFDMPHLARRAMNCMALGPGMDSIFLKLGKFIERKVQNKTSNGSYWSGLAYISRESFCSNQSGTREYDCVRIPGIQQFDIMIMVLSNKKFRSYTLNNVGEEIANMSKLGLDHRGITKHATSQLDIHRSVVTRYCAWDSALTMIVGIQKETYDVTYTQMARVTGVSMKELLTKGQTVKVMSQLLEFNKLLKESKIESEYIKTVDSFLIPYVRKCPFDINPSFFDNAWMVEGENDDLQMLYGLLTNDKYAGGHVFEPHRGFWMDIIITVDFASLYPSIIISFNLCYSTYIGKRSYAENKMKLKCAWDFRPIEEGGMGIMPDDMKEPEGDFCTFQDGHSFVKRHIRVGVLPLMLMRVLSARSGQKKEMYKYDKGTAEYNRHNGAQLALKITANSIYGFTGARKLAARYISAAVTYIGRYLIIKSDQLCIKYGKEHEGYENENKYGDTDSTMNMFTNHPKDKVTNKYEYKQLLSAAYKGLDIAKYITYIFQRQGFFRIVMEFEKIYHGAVFISKKKYAALKYEFDPRDDSLNGSILSSGLETKRRNNTIFTQETLTNIVETVVREKDLDGAISYAQNQCKLLREGRIPMEKLVHTGNFSKRPEQYVNPEKHIEAAKRAMMVDPALAPRVGQRIAYVVVIRDANNAEEERSRPLYERTEVDRVAKMKNMKLDYKHYLDLIIPILSRFFAPCLAQEMSPEEGQSYVERKVFYDYFKEEDELQKFKQSSIVKAFATQSILNSSSKKGKRYYDVSLSEKEENKIKKRRIIDDMARKSFRIKEVNEKEENVMMSTQKNNEYSLNNLITKEKTLSSWFKKAGTDKSGRKYKKKRT